MNFEYKAKMITVLIVITAFLIILVAGILWAKSVASDREEAQKKMDKEFEELLSSTTKSVYSPAIHRFNFYKKFCFLL